MTEDQTAFQQLSTNHRMAINVQQEATFAQDCNKRIAASVQVFKNEDCKLDTTFGTDLSLEATPVKESFGKLCSISTRRSCLH